MKTDLKTFVQSDARAWCWLAVMALSLVAALVACLKGSWSGIFINVFILVVVYWADQLEKEISRRNQK